MGSEATELNRRTLRRVFWSDEPKHNLHVDDGRLRVRYLPNIELELLPQNVLLTVASSGDSVLVWANFSYDPKGDVRLVKGTMNDE